MSDLMLILPTLRALKSQVDAAVMLVEMHLAMTSPTPADPTSCPECGATDEKQQKAPGMGVITTRCQVCGYTRTTAQAPKQLS